MTEYDPDSAKRFKKLAKAEVKAAKKQAKLRPDAGPPASEPASPSTPPGALSPAERSARAAEKKLAFDRWRTAFAAVGALIALASLLIMLRNGC